MQRALIIFATVIVLIGAGVGVYFYIASRSPGVEVAPGSTTGLPSAGQAPTPMIDEPPTTTTVVSPGAGAPRRLVQVSKGPVVAGEAVTNVDGDVSVSYIERQSGNVYHYLKSAGTITRTSNRTVPGIQEAYWLPDASTAFVRYLSGDTLSTINTYALSSDGTNGFFLAQNLTGLAVSSTSVLTLASGVNGSVASTERPDGSSLTTLFTTPLTSLRVGFAGKQYLAFTKPSATIEGHAFLVDAKGRFSRVAGPLHGLVALASPLGKWVLVSYVRSGTLEMRLVNVSTNESLSLPIGTIVDKCVWAADDSAVYCGVPMSPPMNYAYPDDWYQGAVAFSDRIWKVSVDGRYAQLVLDFAKETKGSLDAKALAIDPANTTLAFINKNDGSLWVYGL